MSYSYECSVRMCVVYAVCMCKYMYTCGCMHVCIVVLGDISIFCICCDIELHNISY